MCDALNIDVSSIVYRVADVKSMEIGPRMPWNMLLLPQVNPDIQYGFSHVYASMYGGMRF